MIHPQGEVTHLLGHLESCLQYFYSPQNKFPLKWLRLSFDHHFSRTFHLLRFYHGFCHYFFLHHLYIISFVPALTPSRFPQARDSGTQRQPGPASAETRNYASKRKQKPSARHVAEAGPPRRRRGTRAQPERGVSWRGGTRTLTCASLFASRAGGRRKASGREKARERAREGKGEGGGGNSPGE